MNMSLWNKAADDITLADVENFLRQRNREGLRLDYKADWPDDLAKLVAAFANTNGGLIILGVAADKKTNQPYWPSAPAGVGLLRSDPGIEERITSTCRDGIHPPILPSVSPVFQNPHAPGHALVVIRVDASPEAPHATEGGRRVYERTGSLGKPYDFSRIDRIEHLLNRRRRVEQDREASIQRALDRAASQLVGRRLHYIQPMGPFGPDDDAAYWMRVPLRWVSAIPYYPWADLCTVEECYLKHQTFPRLLQVQRAPEGSFGVHQGPSDKPQQHPRSNLTRKGHVMVVEAASEAAARYLMEAGTPRRTPSDFWLDFDRSGQFLRSTLECVVSFYRGLQELPGHILLSIGLQDARHYRMFREPRGEEVNTGIVRGERFPDESFRADIMVHAADVLDAPDRAAADLLDHLGYGFSLPPIPRPGQGG